MFRPRFRWTTRYRSWPGWASVPILLVLVVASVTMGVVPALASSLRAPSVASQGSLSTDSAPPISHVIVVMDENQEWSEVWQYGSYMKSLAQTYVNYSQFYGIRFPSWTDYIAPTSGQNTTFIHDLSVKDTSLASEIAGAGLSWQALEEGMPSACDPTTDWAASYDIDHNPFIWYKDLAGSACDANDVPFSLSSWDTQVADGDLASYTWVTPNVIDDGHNASNTASCPLATKPTGAEKLKNEVCNASAWIKKFLAPLFSHLSLFDSTAVFITYDSGSKNLKEGFNETKGGPDGGHVYAVLVNPLLSHHSVTKKYTEFDLLTTTQYLLGIGFTLPKNDNPAQWPVMYPWPASG
jgi:hypothetical protein